MDAEPSPTEPDDQKDRREIDNPKRWHSAFLAALSNLGNVTAAARAAEIDRSVVYEERQRNETFALAWADAIEKSIDLLEQEARRRATVGRTRTTTKKDGDGKIVEEKTIEETSDLLLIFLLKAHRPEKFRDNVRVEQSGPGGAAIPIQVTVVDETVEAFHDELERLASD